MFDWFYFFFAGIACAALLEGFCHRGIIVGKADDDLESVIVNLVDLGSEFQVPKKNLKELTERYIQVTVFYIYLNVYISIGKITFRSYRFLNT